MRYIINYNQKNHILALGAESAGNFSVYQNGKIFLSENFEDLLDNNNFLNFKKAVLNYLKINKIKPNIILTDLHPLYKTTILGQELAKKFRAKHILIQHHFAHVFSCYGEQLLKKSKTLRNFFGLACDGTGYGLDDKIWGGEIFKISNSQFPDAPYFCPSLSFRKQIGQAVTQIRQAIFDKIPNSKFKIQRIGHLENQILIGGDLAVREPSRMLISIFNKFLDKKNVYQYIKKYYNKQQFEILYNQLQQNFNCQKTSSTGRILDAVAVLLEFAKNQRNYKHEPINLLEKNSTIPYKNLHPEIQINSEFNHEQQKQNSKFILKTTPLFQYLINNLHRDKKRLAATAQLYIAQGLYKIISKINSHYCTKILKCKYKPTIVLAGGIANNKIISSYLKSKGIITNRKIPAGDAGISFGQIIFYLSANSWN